MGRSRFDRNFSIAAAIVIAVIVYGSLYPFRFRQPVDGLGPAARALFESWAQAAYVQDGVGMGVAFLRTDQSSIATLQSWIVDLIASPA